MEKEPRVLPLVRPARSLEREAEVALLYRTMHAPLLRYAARLVGPEDAEDVLQDALLKFFAQREREDGVDANTGERARLPLAGKDAKLRLLVMVRDVAVDRRRRSRKESRMMALITGPSAAVRRWMSAHRRLDDTDIRGAIHEALNAIPAHERESWLLARELDLDLPDVAAQLGIRTATCRVYVHRANHALARRLRRVGLTPADLKGRGDA